MGTIIRKARTDHWSVEFRKLREVYKSANPPPEPSIISRARGMNPDALRSIIDGLEKDLNFTMAHEAVHAKDPSLEGRVDLSPQKARFGWLKTITGHKL